MSHPIVVLERWSESYQKLVLLALSIAVPLLLLTARRRVRVPPGYIRVPGPPSFPIVGNALQLDRHPQKQFRQWAQQYGELYRLKLGKDEYVMINTPAAAKEILDKQSNITSSRPEQYVLNHEVSGSKRFVLMSNTPTWRSLRAIVHKVLTPKSSLVFRSSQEFEGKQLVYDILTENHDLMSFFDHVRRYTTSVVMTSTYGRRIPKRDSEEIRQVYKVMEEFNIAARPGTFLADSLPVLLWLPKWAQWWRKRALLYYNRQEELWMSLWHHLQKQMEANQAPECFLKHFMETDYKRQDISELQAAFVAGSMIEAGSETTSSTINTAIMHLAANPDAQKKAHAELSAVVGDNRSPTFDDEQSLPYIRAIGKETLRMRPLTLFGAPHQNTTDMTYKNYFIPSGTVLSVSYNVFHYDPDRYEEPFKFRPDRYLNHPEKSGVYVNAADPYERDHFAFGNGRRACPGVHLAENSLYITLAKILWAFEIRPPLGPDGKEEAIDISDDAFQSGGTVAPNKFRARFIPRNETVKKTLIHEWEEAMEEGFYLGEVKVTLDGMVV